MSTRLRWPRVALVATAACVTVVAALGGAGVIGAADAVAVQQPAVTLEAAPAAAAAAAAAAAQEPAGAAPPPPARARQDARRDDRSIGPRAQPGEPGARSGYSAARPGDAASETTAAVPRRSGSGRRVVFSESEQRVWLVGAAGRVRRTYPVSGSIYDNLDPGSYEVYSRSERAWGIDDSGTMRYFVRFTHGENAAIGFHDIPVDDGRRVQRLDELGTPTSHGCIRQRRRDARALWAFAPVGTRVVVTA